MFAFRKLMQRKALRHIVNRPVKCLCYTDLARNRGRSISRDRFKYNTPTFTETRSGLKAAAGILVFELSSLYLTVLFTMWRKACVCLRNWSVEIARACSAWGGACRRGNGWDTDRAAGRGSGSSAYAHAPR